MNDIITGVSICNQCGYMTNTMMDKDGNRSCGKCEEPKKNSSPIDASDEAYARKEEKE